MKTRVNRAIQENNPVWQASTPVLVITAVGLLLSLCGCPQIAKWRDQQIATSHALAEPANATLVPAVPISLPEDVERVIPLTPLCTVLEYTQSNGTHHCRVLSSEGLEETIQWLLSEMQSHGYTLDDNPSRLLEGVVFYNVGAKSSGVNVKVGQNLAKQVLITYDFTQ